MSMEIQVQLGTGTNIRFLLANHILLQRYKRYEPIIKNLYLPLNAHCSALLRALHDLKF